MAYKRTKTVSGGTKTKTRSRVRKDGTTVTKTKTKSKGTKSKSRSVVGKKKTTYTTQRFEFNPGSELRAADHRSGRVVSGDVSTKTTSQSGKAKSKTKVRGKGKVKTRTSGVKGSSTTTTSRVYESGTQRTKQNRKGSSYNRQYPGTTYTESSGPKTSVKKRKGKMSRDIPLPKSNF